MKLGINALFLVPGEVGGSETYFRRTLQALGRARPGWKIRLFANSETAASSLPEVEGTANVVVEDLSFRAANRVSRIVREQTRLVTRVQKSGVDLLWSPGYTAPLFCPCPTVTSVLDMQYRTHPEDLSLPARIATDVLVRGACRRSRLILTISDFSKSEIVRHTGAAAGRIHVTPLAADDSFGSPAAGEAGGVVRELLRAAAPFLLVVANTYPHKNVAAAVRAFGDVMGRIPHRLVLVGRPRRGEKAVTEAVRALPDESRYSRLEYLKSPRDLAALYQGADAFLFPSLYEGFGLPVLEAMRAGTPVVTTGAAAIAEVAADAAVLFDPGRAGDLAAKILQVLGWSPEERSVRVEKARRHAESFSWEKTAEATARAFELALQG